MITMFDTNEAIARANWSPQKQRDWYAARGELDEARRLARLAWRELVTAQGAHQAAVSASVHVAFVTVQLREDAPHFHRLFDVPFEVEESADRTGRVSTYDRARFRELHRRENPHWRGRLAEVQREIPDAEARLKAAEEAHRTAMRAVVRAEQKVAAFG